MIHERDKIQDIINELVHNAMRARASKIDVSIEDLEDTLRITVSDNGDGMKPAMVKRLLASLNSGRRDELEMLAGVDHTRTGLMMVGIMTDKAELESTPGEGTKVIVYRNKAGV